MKLAEKNFFDSAKDPISSPEKCSKGLALMGELPEEQKEAKEVQGQDGVRENSVASHSGLCL